MCNKRALGSAIAVSNSAAAAAAAAARAAVEEESDGKDDDDVAEVDAEESVPADDLRNERGNGAEKAVSVGERGVEGGRAVAAAKRA
jgi:hypothetical protein